MNNKQPNLEKKCIRKVLPEFFGKGKQCSAIGPCNGFDKFCADYIPAASLNAQTIQDYINSLAGNGQKDKREKTYDDFDGSCDGCPTPKRG